MSDFIECGRCLFRVPAGRWSEHVKEWHLGEEPHPEPDMVNAPAHYTVGGIETIDFIEAKGLNYHLANAVKYITRAEHKGNFDEDVSKAIWYLTRERDRRRRSI